MAVTQIADVVVPAQFTAYQVENSLQSTALFRSGALVRNALMDSQLALGSNNFIIPFWADLSDIEANITTDNPADVAVRKRSRSVSHSSISRGLRCRWLANWLVLVRWSEYRSESKVIGTDSTRSD